MKAALKIFVLIFASACASAPPCPAIAPFQSLLHGKPNRNGLDPDIARIFHGRATEAPPIGFQWSPDSRTVAFLETAPDHPNDTRLWVIHVAQRRKRPLFTGDNEKVMSFTWADAQSLLVQTESRIVTVTLDGAVTEILQIPAADALSLQMSPDGQFLSYRKKGNLYVYNVNAREEIALTDIDEPFVCVGCVSWLYEEEFNTAKGYGWSNDSKRIWFRQVDQRLVEKRWVDTEEVGNGHRIAYSKAGESNPFVKIGVVSVVDDSHSIVYADVTADDESYLPDVMWHPKTDRLLVTRLDRLQTRFDLLECDTALVCTPVFTHTDPRWVNYPGLPQFSPNGDSYALAIEFDEFAHVHWFNSSNHQHRPLTAGDFQVFQINGVSNDAVYYTANPTDPRSRELYKVSVTDGLVIPVNDTPGFHEAVVSPDLTHLIDTYSNVDSSPSVHLCDDVGHSLMRIDESENRDYQPPKTVLNEFSTIESERGDTLYIQVTRPAVPDKSKRYPVLVYVYGGPRYQAVMNRYNTTFTAWRNLMAQRGFIIFTLDNRGSAGRGRAFETAVHRNLTAAALEDQLSGVRWLKKQPYVDGHRIGILGWSFGGTMTLTALLHTENVFKLGVAIAPVTDWRRYDTAYTERYMQRPIDNESNYNDTNLTARATDLTEQLMIVHGTADENVLPENSMAMVDALTREGRRVEIRLYPGQGHSIKDRKSRAHLFSEMTRFIEQHL